MNTPKFTTVQSTLGDKVVNRGVIQTERVIGSAEFFKRLNEKSAYAAASGKAVVSALAQAVKTNASRALSSTIEGFVKFQNACRGTFDGKNGPWVKGRNFLVVNAAAMIPFKNLYAGVIPVNRTEGAQPRITTFKVEGLDYDEVKQNCTVGITGLDLMIDPDAGDEFVELVDKNGIQRAILSVTTNTLPYIEATVGLLIGVTDGSELTVRVHTRSGMGSDFGVKVATRKVVFRA